MKIIKNLLLILLILLITFIFLEVSLLFFNPWNFRAANNKINLTKEKQYIIEDHKNIKLDKKIIITKNQYGFRGENPQKNLNNKLSIITVGGSTTECAMTSDEKTWPFILGKKLKKKFKKLWINNAGLSGHSSSAHIILMREYILKIRPKVVLFLTGINDIAIAEREKILKSNIMIKVLDKTLSFWANYSNLFQLLKMVVGNIIVRQIGLGHRIDFKLKNLKSKTLTQEEIDQTIKIHKLNLVKFEKNINKLIEISKRGGVTPVFITQSAICGNVIDNVTGIDLSKIEMGNINCNLYQTVLAMYNNLIKKVSIKNNVFVIDLESQMAKTSKYYYDYIHYTNYGSNEVAEIVFKDLFPYLDKKFTEDSINVFVIDN